MTTHSPRTWDPPSFAPGLTLDLGEAQGSVGPSAWASPGSNETHHSFPDHGLGHDHDPNEGNAAPADWNDAVLAYFRADDAQAALPDLRLRIAEVEEHLMQNEAILLAVRRMNQEAHETQRTDDQLSSNRTCSFAMLWKWFGRPSSVQAPIRLPRHMFQASYTAEANISRQVETMREQAIDLKAETSGCREGATGLLFADCFEVVCQLADIYLPSTATSQSVELMLASHRLRAEEDSVENNRRLLADIGKALADLQASHLLLGEVLNTIEASCESERRARGSFAPMVQVDVVNQYKGKSCLPLRRT
ncbi:hypothetical protein EXIGLDRAFT_748459 [Exidia glandulosa HHB12029]|uniref:Uncharacterized protein n=1 Tax=Exidia glandulosa HHB12029 TaxID=1314781 RepID=A0A165JFS7_EXIGL|nr:hypothetical protein EXIGLDRAFT_748459 [Exidia glandulosa HHB12029]